MTKVLFKFDAMNSARSLLFSTILILACSKELSRFFARLKPMLPPPIIKNLLDIF